MIFMVYEIYLTSHLVTGPAQWGGRGGYGPPIIFKAKILYDYREE